MPAAPSSPITAVLEKTGPGGLDPVRVQGLGDAFAAVPDPRAARGRWHPLTAILLIAACAVTCDADGITAIGQWVDDADDDELARLGVRTDPLTGRPRPPSERTIRRVLTTVDPQAVQAAAGTFVTSRLTAVGLRPARLPAREREQRRAAVHDHTHPKGRPRRRSLAFDGKAVRGARRPGGGRVNLLAGIDQDSGTVIGQRAIHAKTNEIPELRTLIAGLNVTDCIITADAAHCQRATANAIIAAGAHYLLTIKANQVGLLTAVIPLLAGTNAEWANRSHHSHSRGHGRTETRIVRVAAATGIDFPHAAQIFRTVRHTGGLDGQRTRKQIVYGITSLHAHTDGPADIAGFQRRHWSIENKTHHVRDTTFDEDHSQVRTGHAPHNMATLRNLAIDTIRASGRVNIAHARRHHTHDYTRVLDLYGL